MSAKAARTHQRRLRIRRAAHRAARTLEVPFMCFAASVGIAAIGGIGTLHLPGFDPVFLVGSLGASAVLVFAAPESPMSRARNVIGGQFLSALIGVTCFKLLGDAPHVAGGVAVGLAIFAMHHTRSLHAPGGATALIANIGSEKVKALGYGYAFAPVLTGVAVLMLVAFVAKKLRASLAVEQSEAGESIRAAAEARS